jgi:hypothetical protein
MRFFHLKKRMTTWLACFLCYVFMALATFSCIRDTDRFNPTDNRRDFRFFKSYLIKEGNHSSVVAANMVVDNQLSFLARFDSSAIYTTRKPENQASVNKLLGFSDCSSHHHENSARFGWRWYKNNLEIFAYVYANGKRKFKKIGNAQIGKTHQYTLKNTEDAYVFLFRGQRLVMKKQCRTTKNYRFKLFPYFGGPEPAPHKIKIDIMEV